MTLLGMQSMWHDMELTRQALFEGHDVGVHGCVSEKNVAIITLFVENFQN